MRFVRLACDDRFARREAFYASLKVPGRAAPEPPHFTRDGKEDRRHRCYEQVGQVVP